MAVNAYYRKNSIEVVGDSKIFARVGQDHRGVRTHFCPHCGTTVFFELDLRPDYLGVAVGAFADPDYPEPSRSVWEISRHPWVEFGHTLKHYARQSPPAPTDATASDADPYLRFTG